MKKDKDGAYVTILQDGTIVRTVDSTPYGAERHRRIVEDLSSKKNK